MSFILVSKTLSNVQVILGEHNWKSNEKHEQYFSVKEMHQHPRYNSHTYDSDITLVRLTPSAIMNDYIQPVCLPVVGQNLLRPGNIGTISGWGARNVTKRLRPVKTLHKVDLPVVSNAICQKAFTKYRVTSNMFCAGDKNGTADACQGDSGGPLTLVNPTNGRTTLAGLVSWGESCGAKNKYGVYTKVENYLGWIKPLIRS